MQSRFFNQGWVVGLSAVWLVHGSAASFAQDMSFSQDEVPKQSATNLNAPPSKPAVQPAVREIPPSPELARALAMYDAGKYEDAAVALHAIANSTQPRTQLFHKQKAQFVLGKSLYHLKFYQSALSVFDEISQAGAAHAFFGQTLQWLAQLASQLPEPAGIVEKVGRYGMEELNQFNTAESAEFYHHLLFLMGRYKYQQGEFEESIRLFNAVAPDSEWFVPGKFFEGIAYVRLHKAQPAINAFRSIVDTIEDGKARKLKDEGRMKDLAWLSLARVYYAAANQGDDTAERQEINGRILGNAIEAWNKIGIGSEYWLDAMFEESWALFLADEYSRALGNIHTLRSPYFEKAYYPEALVLKSVVFFANCQMDNAEAIVHQFHQEFDPVKVELEKVLAQHQDNAQFFEFLQRVRQNNANLPPKIRGIVYTALSDRTLLRNLEYYRVLQEEEKRLEKSDSSFVSSAVGARVLEDITLAKSFAVDQTGDLARGRYQRLIEELQDLENQVDAVEVEIATFERGQLSQELQQQQIEAARLGRGRVEVDEEHQLWRFDGEYWRDELGFYRQEVTSRCGR
jgi:hypothetical protein